MGHGSTVYCLTYPSHGKSFSRIRALKNLTRLMASPAAAPAAEFTQMEAARQSLIAISQSVPEIGAPVVRSPNGGMEHGHDDRAEQRYRAKLISISNQSPDARPAPCLPKNAAA
ncbi:hypothetical protein SETIT_7G217300v2 [Setaria italica]|uniref:Uncharacterized protein n=1 Tax=Setaria italica TaxID=4555 RepID=A0A368RYC6_SETIT|nr:hypothetical protein SETIT_7G217300v2 [Setaria italica]